MQPINRFPQLLRHLKIRRKNWLAPQCIYKRYQQKTLDIESFAQILHRSSDETPVLTAPFHCESRTRLSSPLFKFTLSRGALNSTKASSAETCWFLLGVWGGVWWGWRLRRRCPLSRGRAVLSTYLHRFITLKGCRLPRSMTRTCSGYRRGDVWTRYSSVFLCARMRPFREQFVCCFLFSSGRWFQFVVDLKGAGERVCVCVCLMACLSVSQILY